MTTSKIQLWGGGITGTRVVKANSITPSGNKQLAEKPNANVGGPVKVHTGSFENIDFNISGVHFVHPSLSTPTNVLTWSDVLTLYRHQYDDTNPVYLNVVYGYGTNQTTLTTIDSAGSTLTNIKCVLKNFSYPIDVTDSKEGYMPKGSLNFVETD